LMHENEIGTHIVTAAIKVHRALGPGLLEHIYCVALQYELRQSGLWAEREVPIAISYEALHFENAFKADILVEDKVIVEAKTVEEIHARHRMQLHSYLKLADKRLGYLINFNVALLKDGIHRIVNRLQE
jgi:GxxExxY protein